MSVSVTVKTSVTADAVERTILVETDVEVTVTTAGVIDLVTNAIRQLVL